MNYATSKNRDGLQSEQQISMKEKLKELKAIQKEAIKEHKGCVKSVAQATRLEQRAASKVGKISDKVEKLEAKLNPTE